MYIYFCVSMYLLIHLPIYISTCLYIFIHLCTYVFTYPFIYLHFYMFIYFHTFMHLFIQLYFICLYIFLHIYVSILYIYVCPIFIDFLMHLFAVICKLRGHGSAVADITSLQLTARSVYHEMVSQIQTLCQYTRLLLVAGLSDPLVCSLP